MHEILATGRDFPLSFDASIHTKIIVSECTVLVLF